MRKHIFSSFNLQKRLIRSLGSALVLHKRIRQAGQWHLRRGASHQTNLQGKGKRHETTVAAWHGMVGLIMVEDSCPADGA